MLYLLDGGVAASVHRRSCMARGVEGEGKWEGGGGHGREEEEEEEEEEMADALEAGGGGKVLVEDEQEGAGYVGGRLRAAVRSLE